MTDVTQAQEPSRRLFLNGEALRLEVDFAPTGGGPKYEPFTSDEAREWLLPQIQSARDVLDALPPELRAADRVYVEAKLLPNYIAPTYFPEALLSSIGAVSVGSRADQGLLRTASQERQSGTRRLILAVDDNALAVLESLVESGGRGRSEQQAFAQIQRLEEVAPPRGSNVLKADLDDERIRGRADTLWEAVLHPRAVRSGEAVPIDNEAFERWVAWVEAHNGEVHRNYVRRVGGLTFMPVRVPTDAAPDLVRFNPLRVLRPMPGIRPRPNFGLRSAARVTPPASAVPTSDVTSVAVFDGGVDDPGSACLFPISRIDLTPEPSEADDLAHGTGVTGAVMYGLVQAGEQAPTLPLPVDSYRVMPAPYDPADPEGYWVLDRIKDTLQDGSHKIVNLSLGPSLAVEDDMEPNRWTAELDQLAWENDIVFVVAAGNDGEEDQVLGLHRVQVPADMANGVSVGACDVAAPSRPWARAPYSSMGPGRPGNRIQPLGVQFGGVEDRPFDLLRADGSFLQATGTSFAAPVQTHALADLVTRLPRVNSSVLRAFSVHFAERHRAYRARQDELGHGRFPLTFADSLDSTADEVHVLYVDQINRGDILGYQIPLPSTFRSRVQVQVTLAYASPVEPTQSTEYTSASLELTMRPNRNMFRFAPPSSTAGTAASLDLRSNEARRLLTAGWSSSQEPVAKTMTSASSLNEADLRDAGKWETLRHYRVNLADSEAEDPRLEVRYVARRAGELDGVATEVPFAILVSITDPASTNALHDAARAQYGALRPAQRVAGRVRLRGTRTTSWY